MKSNLFPVNEVVLDTFQIDSPVSELQSRKITGMISDSTGRAI